MMGWRMLAFRGNEKLIEWSRALPIPSWFAGHLDAPEDCCLTEASFSANSNAANVVWQG